MSTPRRRPTGATRRPQVAGRPRTAAAGTSDSDETTEGGLAVDERTDTRTGTTPPAPAETSGLRPRTVTRPGARPAGDEEQADEPAPGSETTGTDTATAHAPGTPSDDGLPSAPAVRSGGSDETDARGAGALARLRRIPLPSAPATRRGTAALLAVTILLVAAAGFFAVSWARMEFSGATSNTALSDVGTTATVSEQVNGAVTKVYSFDFARLDQAEADARGVITGPFNGQFDQIFGNVRQLAPKQQAVVTATIPKSAVASIDGSNATVYVFVNQVIRRVDDGGKPQQGTAAARLRVDAQYVDGQWKIAGMTPA